MDFAVAIWRGKWLLLLTLVLGAVGAVAAYFFTPSVFQSTAVFRVQSSAPEGEGAVGTRINADSFVGIVNQPEFQQEVIGESKVGLSSTFSDVITAERSGPDFFRVNANADSAKRSKAFADKAVKIILEKSGKITGDDPTRGRITEQLLDPAIAEIEKLTVSLEEARARSGATSPNGAESMTRMNELLGQLKLAEPTLLEPDSAQTNAELLAALRDEFRNLAATSGTADGKAVADRVEMTNLTRRIQNLEKAYSVYWDYMVQLILRDAITGEHLVVVSQPQLPRARDAGNLITNSAIGAVLGLLLGLVVAVLEEGRRRVRLERPADSDKEGHGAPGSEASGGFGI